MSFDPKQENSGRDFLLSVLWHFSCTTLLYYISVLRQCGGRRTLVIVFGAFVSYFLSMFLSSPGGFCSTIRSVFCVLRGCSSCVSKLFWVLFAFTGISLREPGHDMDGLTNVNSHSEVDRWLRKGFRSCGKSAAMTPAGTKNEHGGHNVPGAPQ